MRWIHLATGLNQQDADAIRVVLSRAGIPYRASRIPGPPSMQVFAVPQRDVGRAARTLTAAGLEVDLDAPRPEPVPEAGSATLALRVWVGASALALAQTVWGVLQPAWQTKLVAWGAFVPARAFEGWRWFTTALIHGSPYHAAGNAVAGGLLGIPVWSRRGAGFAIGLFLLGVVGGDLAVLTLNDPQTRVIGASAGVAAFVGWLPFEAWVERGRERRGRRWAAGMLGLAAWFLPGLFDPISRSGAPVSLAGHLGGWLAGSIAGCVWWLRSVRNRRRRTG